MADHRSTHYAAPHLSHHHHYPSYPSSTHVTYPSAYAVSPSTPAYPTSNHFSDSELQSAATLTNAYYTTPRSMQPQIGSPPQVPMNAHYGSYPPAQSMPIPVQRPQYTHSVSMPYGHGFAPSSPHTDGSPESPMSPLAQYSHSPSSADAYSTPQYPASPQRPYACDLCVLSFSRQHDLKRHRDTHSGEKPFTCDGGCGKNFTRKDALKRHQLVKRCGTEFDR